MSESFDVQLDSATASRLCGACGMCCDGTMFYAVNLQPGDSAKELQSLGLRLKRKKQRTFFTQSCAAFRGTHCGIYEQRPQRCRLFQCQQIDRVTSGKITEVEALSKIRKAREHVAGVRQLLVACGSTNLRRSLTARYEAALAQPVDAEMEPELAKGQQQLQAAMKELEALLTEDFRQKVDGVLEVGSGEAIPTLESSAGKM